MKTVQILTFSNTMNYGAMLQAYALREVVSKCGFEAKICDYRQPMVEEFEFFVDKKTGSTRDFVNRVLRRILFRRKRALFSRFRRESLNLTPRLEADDLDQVLMEASAVIVGSDQVWNGAITGNDCSFLPDLGACGPSVLSYAASCGSNTSFLRDSRHTDRLRELCSPVLVRDQLTARTVEEASGVQSEVVLDPTLLLSKRRWESLVEPHCPPADHHYVLAYTVYEIQKTKRFASKLSRESGLRFVHLHQYDARPTIGAMNVYSGTPLLLPSLVSQATAVVTSSFHGMCMSLALEKPFYIPASSASPEDLDPRWGDLLREAGFTDEDFLFDEAAGMLGPFYCDRRVSRVLDASRARSISLLTKQLEEAAGVSGTGDYPAAD